MKWGDARWANVDRSGDGRLDRGLVTDGYALVRPERPLDHVAERLDE